MRGSRKFFQRGSNFDYGFLLFKYLYKRAIIGSSAKCHLNGVSLACQWWPNIECWLGSFVVLQGIRTSIGKKPYIFVIFQGGVRTPCPPPLWIRTCQILHISIWIFQEETQNDLQSYDSTKTIKVKQPALLSSAR